VQPHTSFLKFILERRQYFLSATGVGKDTTVLSRVPVNAVRFEHTQHIVVREAVQCVLQESLLVLLRKSFAEYIFDRSRMRDVALSATGDQDLDARAGIPFEEMNLDGRLRPARSSDRSTHSTRTAAYDRYSLD
jgi:hypothetical protein